MSFSNTLMFPRKVLPGMIQRMETSLRSFGMTSAGHGGGLKDRAAARLAKCAHMLLLAFVENRYERESVCVCVCVCIYVCIHACVYVVWCSLCICKW